LILAAIETVGLKPLTDYLSLFGGWPMALDHWDESNFDWKKASASAFTTFNLPLLVDFFNDLDSNNTQRTVIYVDQESLFLPRSILVDLNESPVIATAYIELMIESAKTARDWLRNDVSDTEIEGQAHEVLKFESQLAMVKIKIRNVHFLLFLTIHCKFHTDHSSR
jgi:predicted metalloendopeptidase